MNIGSTVLGGSTLLRPLLARLLIYLAPVALFIVLGIVMESWLVADEQEDDQAKLFNLVISLIISITDVGIGIWLLALLTSVMSKIPLHGLISLPLQDHGKIWIAIPLALFNLCVGDFFYYWMHRAQHSWKWLWVQHKIHHTEEHMNVTTALRAHWTEVPMHIVFINAPLALLFNLPIVTIGLASLVVQSVKYFIHLNARISLGPLNRVFCTPHTHRIHHSSLEKHWGKNFCSALSLWDVLFGTHYQPAPDEWPPCGIPNEKALSIASETVMPLVQWGKMLNQVRLRAKTLVSQS